MKISKMALCIGNNDYSILPKLNYAVNDAKEISEKLNELGFNVVLKNDLNRAELIHWICEFSDKAKEYDVALLYYAGHGFEVAHRNILAPIDLNVNPPCTDNEIYYNSYCLDELLEKLDDVGYSATTKIIILDACRSSNIGSGARGGNFSFGPLPAPQGSIVAFSTSPGKTAMENSELQHGYYTSILLDLIELPRTPIESVFKKVREKLNRVTNGRQISWEHTSLVGNFFFNPDTIYDFSDYLPEALSDSKYHVIGREIRDIVEMFKSHNWFTQNDAINLVYSLDFTEKSANDLFVLGRNIYQSAEGGANKAASFIDVFPSISSIPINAKIHVLNGMVYEIYYDSNNELRKKFKGKYYMPLIKTIEKDAFFGCCEFISEKLKTISDRVIYVPGQNETIVLNVVIKEIENDYYVEDIIHDGKSVYYDVFSNMKADSELNSINITVSRFEHEIARKMVAPIDRVQLVFENGSLKKQSKIYCSPIDSFEIRPISN